jgi:hypothetical protein
MGVTLYYPSTGSPTHSVELPYPETGGQPVTVGTQQSIGRTPSGTPFVQSHGGTWYRISQTFTSLSAAETEALYQFLVAINWAGSEIRKHYRDVENAADRDVYCKVVYPTDQTRLAYNVRDITLVFEQREHPDHVTDAASTAETAQGGGVVGAGTFDEPAITSAPAAYGQVGEAFSYTITADGAATITFGASGMPAWMSRAGAVLSGTPTPGDHGTTEVTITATNSDGADSQPLSVRIEIEAAAPVIEEFPPIVHGDGAFFPSALDVISIDLLVEGTRPLTLGTPTGSLPAGLSWNSTTLFIEGTITGGTTGGYAWSISFTNDEGSDTATVYFAVDTAPAVTAGDGAKVAYVGDVVSWPLTVTAWQGADVVLSGSLPGGLTYDGATRTVSGTVASGQEGSYTYEVEFTNDFGTDTATFNIEIPTLVPLITAEGPIEPDESTAFSYFVTAYGSPAPTFSLVGEPGWVSINSTTGEITGTAPAFIPMDPNEYTFEVIATNTHGSDNVDPFTIVVQEVP